MTCSNNCNQGRDCSCVVTGHITWDASAPLEVTLSGTGETALTVTADGRFIWADNADELIDRADGATKHVLIALREALSDAP